MLRLPAGQAGETFRDEALAPRSELLPAGAFGHAQAAVWRGSDA